MKRRKKFDRSFPVSLHGFVYSAAGATLALTGLFRGEIVSSICGTALVLYSLFCLSCATLAYFRNRSRTATLTWEDGSRVRLAATGKNAAFADVSYNAHYEVIPETPFTEPFYLEVPAMVGESFHRVALPPRGWYRCDEASTVIRDFSDFFRFTISYPESFYPESFCSLPLPESPLQQILPEGKTGVSRGKSTFKRSDDLYEIRPYAPGDDPRKINWKLYAHTGSLMLREGELLPPPSTEYVFLFNTDYPTEIRTGSKWRTRNTQLSKNAQRSIKTHFDSLLNRAAYIACALLEQRRIVSIQVPSENGDYSLQTVHPDDPDGHAKILDSLSRIQPGHPAFSAASPSLSFLNASSVLFFTMPECETIPEWLPPHHQNIAVMAGPWIENTGYRDRILSLHQKLLTGGYNASKT